MNPHVAVGNGSVIYCVNSSVSARVNSAKSQRPWLYLKQTICPVVGFSAMCTRWSRYCICARVLCMVCLRSLILYICQQCTVCTVLLLYIHCIYCICRVQVESSWLLYMSHCRVDCVERCLIVWFSAKLCNGFANMRQYQDGGFTV